MIVVDFVPPPPTGKKTTFFRFSGALAPSHTQRNQNHPNLLSTK